MAVQTGPALWTTWTTWRLAGWRTWQINRCFRGSKQPLFSLWGRVLEPIPAAYRRRQFTPLDKLPADYRVVCEHVGNLVLFSRVPWKCCASSTPSVIIVDYFMDKLIYYCEINLFVITDCFSSVYVVTCTWQNSLRNHVFSNYHP